MVIITYYVVKAQPQVLYGKYSTRGEVECKYSTRRTTQVCGALTLPVNH